ncbi:MAG: hypothetical protein FJ128_00400 [Deltaproteobacteria bacterium]|nr:hypothetical protein [Deltaproteobacteria bacterium]
MYEGLWTVEFISEMNRTGKGVIILTKDGRLLGGDSGYYYSGTYNIANDNKISGQVLVIRYNPNAMSVLGDKNNFKLYFTGQIDNLHLSATAKTQEMPQYTMKIIANRKADF